MEVDIANPGGGTIEVDGLTYYFCSTFCRAKFVADHGVSGTRLRGLE